MKDKFLLPTGTETSPISLKVEKLAGLYSSKILEKCKLPRRVIPSMYALKIL